MESSTGSAEREISIQWAGKQYEVCVSATEAVADIKRRLGDLTRVVPKRQKLLGLKEANGKPATDESLVSNLSFKSGKVMMLGTPEEVILATNELAAEASDIHDDFQIADADFAALDPAKDPDVLRAAQSEARRNRLCFLEDGTIARMQDKLQRRLDSVEVKVLNPPRAGKKLLVLDIDYTIFDLGSASESPEQLARPHLHKFMRACYEHYDLVIWSATSMKWVETKMRGLGVLSHPDYKISFMLDFRAMVTVHTEARGVFDCKPLAFIWRKFPEFYNESNTVMLDDLRRNYIMNRQQGLVIRAYTKSHKRNATDRELVNLKYYLLAIAQLPSLSALNHDKWHRYMLKAISDEDRVALALDLSDP